MKFGCKSHKSECCKWCQTSSVKGLHIFHDATAVLRLAVCMRSSHGRVSGACDCLVGVLMSGKRFLTVTTFDSEITNIHGNRSYCYSHTSATSTHSDDDTSPSRAHALCN